MARTNKNARIGIVKILKEHEWYGVSWSTHFCGNVFLVYELNKKRTPDRYSDIYGAIFESIYDLDGSNSNNGKSDKQLLRIDNCKSWNIALDNLIEYCEVISEFIQ